MEGADAVYVAPVHIDEARLGEGLHGGKTLRHGLWTYARSEAQRREMRFKKGSSQAASMS